MPQQKTGLEDLGFQPITPTASDLSDLGFTPQASPQAVHVSDDRTAGQVAKDQAWNAATGIPRAVTGLPAAIAALPVQVKDLLMDAITGQPFSMNTKTSQNLAQMAQPATTAIRGAGALVAPSAVTAPTSPEWEQAAQGAGTMLGSAILPEAIRPIRAGIKYVPERLGSSIVKPLEANKDFGANPVKAFNENVGVAASMKSAIGKIDAATTATEGELMRAAAKYSQAKGDIAPAMWKAVDPVLKELWRDGKDAVAKQVTEMVTRRLDEIKKQYGTTTLNPVDIINVKRGLKQGIKFTEDTTQESLNTAKMAAYRGIDNILDQLTNNETKSINDNYAGLIEAGGRLKVRQQQLLNRDFASVKGGINSLIDRLPDMPVKTMLIQLFRQR